MSLENLDLREEYRTGDVDLIREFYRPCLLESQQYDRAVGYFRSSVFLLIGTDFLEFARREGKIRLICSPCLTETDVEAIVKGYKSRKDCVSGALIRDIDELLSTKEIVKNTEALATLISLGSLEIKIVFKPDSLGIYHEKIGLLSDAQGGCVSFKGSVNETWNGWHERGNYETLDVFCNWLGGRDRRQVKRNKEYFNQLWDGKIQDLEVHNFPDVAKEKLKTVAKSSLDEIEPGELTNYFNVGKAVIKMADKSEAHESTKRKPFKHQIEAIDAWKNQGKRGILEHATGSGKTFTALTAIKEHLDDCGVALVLVPDRLLHKQWLKEIKEEIPRAVILKVGAGHNSWRNNKRLRQFTQPGSNLGKRVVLATMPTARLAEFREGIWDGEHLMVVADEVHEIGSPENSKALSIRSGSCMGLSATPRRYGDSLGTDKILNYFGPVVEPPFLLKDAIDSGRLVQYEYHPEAISLTADESEKWEIATKEISKEYARTKRNKQGDPLISPRLKTMLIQRSRIAKKAAAKVPYAVRVVEENYADGESWLIYCEDQYQLREVMNNLTKAGYEPCEYHTAMEGDSAASLDWFKKFGGLMVSIRCLDQGVDIPKISHAVILASSQNPRQFIQRRGRVLRVYPGKYKATIYDAVVVPICLDKEPGQLSLLKSELQRSIQFSKMAVNRSGSNKLMSIAIELGIDPEESGLVDTDGFEESGDSDVS